MEPMAVCEEMSQFEEKEEETARSASSPSVKQRLIDVLNHLEVRVEKLCKDASRIEEEKERLLDTLDSIKDSEWLLEFNEPERENIQHSVDRLLTHCSTVETAIHTHRNQQQEESLYKVNDYIDRLVVEMKNDPVAACERCRTFLRTCVFQSIRINNQSFNSDFECAIDGCTRNDQNRVKNRLQGLLDYFTGVQFTEI